MSEEPIVQFPGETPWDALVSHTCMNIVEEDSFLEYVIASGIDPNVTTLAELEELYIAWRASRVGMEEL